MSVTPKTKFNKMILNNVTICFLQYVVAHILKHRIYMGSYKVK